ncbi:MAG: hypothetical protein H6Q91_2376 [Deltaproteobacteria bacterium]|nr:hypothetical protein [Deltaproteobacteria bacterium]
MIGECAHPELGDLADAAQVRVEDAGLRAVEGRRHVVGAGRAGLLERRHALDAHRRVRQPAEERRQPRRRVVEDRLVAGEHLHATLIRVWVEKALFGVEAAQRRAEVRRLESFVREDRPHLALDALDLAQADRVDLVGRSLRRGVGAQRPAVVEGTFGVLPGAHVLGRLRLQLGQVLGELLPRGQHDDLDLLAYRLRELIARLGREPLDGADALRERGQQHILVGAPFAERLDLSAHAQGDEARRHDAARGARAHRRDHLVDRGAEAREARDVILGVARVVERMDVQHEVGKRHLHAVELIQRIVVELERLAVHDVLQEPVENRGREALFRRLRRRRVAAQCPQVGSRRLGFPLHELDREVVELPVVAADPIRLEHTELREQHRVPEQQVEEHAGVEVFDRPGLAPDRRHQEGTESQQHQCRRGRSDPKRTAHAGSSQGWPT